MKSRVLYVLTVLIWGSTWLAIEFQLGVVAPEVSLVYRFSIAAVLMWLYCILKNLPLRYSLEQHMFFVFLAVLNFGANYLLLYWAQAYLNSALSSIAFSTLLIMNIINNRVFFGQAIAPRMLLGALLGLAGIIALFWQDLSRFDLSSKMLIGLTLSIGGTLVASLGNMTSVRNSKYGIGVLPANAWGMLYSSVLLTAYVLFSGGHFTIDYTAPYILSLLYLSLFGTVLAFAFYFELLKEVGAAKASYTVVLFPVVAVILSMIFEGFIWQQSTVLGFSLVLLGNILVLTPLQKLKRLVKG